MPEQTMPIEEKKDEPKKITRENLKSYRWHRFAVVGFVILNIFAALLSIFVVVLAADGVPTLNYPVDKMMISDFGKQARSRYPQYAGMNDKEIGRIALRENPVYSDRVIDPDEQQEARKKGVRDAILISIVSIAIIYGILYGIKKAYLYIVTG